MTNPSDTDSLLHLLTQRLNDNDLAGALDLATTLAARGELPIVEVFQTSGALEAAGRREQAIALLQLWVDSTESPVTYAVLFNLGVSMANNGDDAGAERAYRRSLELKPTFIEAHLNLATLMERQGDSLQAIKLWNRVTALALPSVPADRDFHVQALNNMGRVLENRKQLPEAEAVMLQSLAIDPHQPKVLTHVIHLRQKQCAWPIYAPIAGIGEAEMLETTSALAMLSASSDPQQQLDAARRFVAEKVLPPQAPLAPEGGYDHARLRIGYLSSDLCSHAVSILTAELYELHDRDRVEVFAFSWSREDGTPLRARVVKAMDHYIPITALGDEEAAQLIRSHEIDVLVDLHGLTMGTRPDILSYRPAPVQLTYLGFPGPTALPCIDYVIADRFVLPPELAAFFTERPLYMPESFQINDRQRAIAATPTRASVGLPEDAFVFCSFNNNFKFTEDVFASWMRILARTPDSVLWLVSDHDVVRTNLRAAATAQGIDPARLHFADRAAPADYLARYQVADLFLDTIPFNAGTTASDALWAGLPLLTCSERTFSSRMAGSLLLAAGLPELITYDLAEYEEKAVALAHDRAHLATLRKKLSDERDTCSLFDTPRFVRNFETLLETLVRARREGGDIDAPAPAAPRTVALPRSAAPPAPVPVPVPEPSQAFTPGHVLLVLYSEDIPTAVATATALDDCRVVVFDPLLLDPLLAAGVAAEYVECTTMPAFPELHEQARSTALAIEERLLALVQPLVPAVARLSWGHLDLYYFLMGHRSHAAIGQYLASHMAGATLHLLVNDNPASFYWPSFVPTLVIMEMLNFAGIAFEAHRYGVRADETNVAPMLVGTHEAPVDVLTHLPTCVHDVAFLNEELAASGRTIFNLHSKYWDIALTAQSEVRLLDIDNLLSVAPPAFTEPVEQFRALVAAELDAVLAPYISTPSFRARQVTYFSRMYRAQFITYVLLNSYFSAHLPGKILLSGHDAGFHGPIVSFAERHRIPVLLFPHSKTTADLQFDGAHVTTLTHPMQGHAILDAAQQPTRNVLLAYPERFGGSSVAPAPLKRVGLLLNALSVNGIMSGTYGAYIAGIRSIADWCAQRGLELVVRGRPGMPMMTLLERDAGIDVASAVHATAISLADYAASVDLCLMYDAPTTAELEFLRNAVPILNPIAEPLSRCESMTSNTDVIPQAGIAATLAKVDTFIDNPQLLQSFRNAQFGAYASLFGDAHALRFLL